MIGNPAELAIDAMESVAERKVREEAPALKLGVVRSVSGSIAQITIDGDGHTTPVTAMCPGLAANKRALLIRDKTQWYAIGVKQ